MNTRQNFFDLNLETLKAELKDSGLPEFRAKQLWHAFYVDLVSDISEVTTFSKDLRASLADKFEFTHLHADRRVASVDNQTVKTLFKLPDGSAIETVLMRYESRQTLCISSQSGCAMGCVFCATGQMGFARHLSAGEIVEQVLVFARELKQSGQVVTNIVIMGMGEPFHNYEAVMTAIERLNAADGFNLGARRFTISTVGLVPMIRRFADEKSQVNLAISLHAANETLRASLLPIAKKHPLPELIEACHYYVNATHRRLTFEWALIQGVNDSDNDALELTSLVKGMLCHVNIIPLNPTRAFQGQATTHERAVAFKNILDKNNIPCTIRLRRGIDINAGCGQLASENQP